MCALALGLALTAACARGQAPSAPARTRPAAPRWAPGLEGRTDQAIRRGLEYLYRSQRADGSWPSKYGNQHAGGVASLALVTALSCGRPTADMPLVRALEYVNGLEPRTVYVRAARAMAYALLKGTDAADRLQTDATWLAEHQHRSGGWGYGPGHRSSRTNPQMTDVSNTFLAMRALRDASAAGARVPPEVWSRCHAYWSRIANPDGGIGYQPRGRMAFRLRGSSYGSMTAAGLTALHMLAGRRAALTEAPFFNAGMRRTNPLPYQPIVEGALKWLGDNIALQTNPKWVWGEDEAYEYYYLFCLQQLADAAGLREIGGREFVRGSVRLLLKRQRPAGSWSRPGGNADGDDLIVIRTCFALLALQRARGPLALHKLRLPDDPDNDPLDAVHLVRYLGRLKPMRNATWRRATLATPDHRLDMAPLLYVCSPRSEFPDGLAERLRSFVRGGGTVLYQPFAAEPDAVEAAKAFLATALPDLTPAPVPDSHPVFSLHFDIPLAGRPKLFGFGDGCRTRVFVLLNDLSGAWHQNRLVSHAQFFQLAANIALYTTDFVPLPSKLRVQRRLPELPEPLRRIRVARARHGGDWNVCPGALEGLDRVLNQALSLGVEQGPAVDPAEGIDPNVTLLWMTGTSGPTLSPRAMAETKRYLLAGGTLMIDSAMGGEAFHDRARRLVAGMFGDDALRPAGPGHPLRTGSFAGGVGSDLSEVAYTRAAVRDGVPELMPLEIVPLDGRAAVVISPYAVTCPLLARPTYGCKGLATLDAARLAANVTLYAATRR